MVLTDNLNFIKRKLFIKALFQVISHFFDPNLHSILHIISSHRGLQLGQECISDAANCRGHRLTLFLSFVFLNLFLQIKEKITRRSLVQNSWCRWFPDVLVLIIVGE